MKTTLILLLFCFHNNFSQDADSKAKQITAYADSIDAVISEHGGSVIFSNTVTTNRMERAIGLQRTKITFYFTQRDDSLVETEDKMVFIRRYNPPLKISIEYNIAASQQVAVNYYYNNGLAYYTYKSVGDYGYDEQRYWFSNSEAVKYVKYTAPELNTSIYRIDKLSKEEYNNSLLILDHAKEYEVLYYRLFAYEMMDK